MAFSPKHLLVEDKYMHSLVAYFVSKSPTINVLLPKEKYTKYGRLLFILSFLIRKSRALVGRCRVVRNADYRHFCFPPLWKERTNSTNIQPSRCFYFERAEDAVAVCSQPRRISLRCSHVETVCYHLS